MPRPFDDSLAIIRQKPYHGGESRRTLDGLPKPGWLGHEAPMNSTPCPDGPQQAAPGGAGAAPGGQARARHAALCGDPAAEPGQRRRALLRRRARAPAGPDRRGPQGDRARARRSARRRRGCTISRARPICGRTRTTRRCKASAAPSRPIRRLPTPTATAARCCPRWAARRRRSPTSTARWRCGRTTPRTTATAPARWPISAGSTRRWQGFDRAIALMPAMAPAYFNRADVLMRLGRAGRSAARLRPGHRALSGDRRGACQPRMALKALGRLDEALASSTRRSSATQVRAAHAGRGQCSSDGAAQGELERAASSIRIRGAGDRISAALSSTAPPPASRRSDRRGAAAPARRGPRTPCSSPRRHARRPRPRRR